MRFQLTWLLLVAISVWVGLLALVWGLRSGQFSDQDRARFLALSDERLEFRPHPTLWKGRERYAFLLISAALLIVLGMAIYLGMTAGKTM